MLDVRRVRTDTWDEVEMEPLGRKVKTWLLDQNRHLWLFKHVRRRTDDGPHQAEDVAELLAAAVAAWMALPHAHVHLAQRSHPEEHPEGIISLHVSAVPDPESGLPVARGRFTHGDDLLQRFDTEYPTDAKGEVPGYSPTNVLRALAGVAAHPALEGTALRDATHQFAAYLAFDALINATDRHHQNWAVLEEIDNPYLVETYDHGTCLGVQEQPAVKQDRLDDSHAATVAGWMQRGRTKFEGHPTPLDAALDAMRSIPTAAAAEIRERIAGVTPAWFARTIDRVPNGMVSQLDRRFAVELLRTARKELLDVDL